jgi:hypothetical protein
MLSVALCVCINKLMLLQCMGLNLYKALSDTLSGAEFGFLLLFWRFNTGRNVIVQSKHYAYAELMPFVKISHSDKQVAGVKASCSKCTASQCVVRSLSSCIIHIHLHAMFIIQCCTTYELSRRTSLLLCSCRL